MLKKNILFVFLDDILTRHQKHSRSKFSHIFKFMNCLSHKFSIQLVLKGLGFIFRIIKSRENPLKRFLKFSIGLSKKFLIILPCVLKLRVERKLKLFLRSYSLNKLTLFVSCLNKIRSRSFYKKFKGISGIFEKIKILKMKKGY